MTSIRHTAPTAILCLIILCLVSLPASASELVFAQPVVAYVGPGAGLGLLGSLLAILIVVVLGLVGLVVYPLKLILRLRRNRSGRCRRWSLVQFRRGLKNSTVQAPVIGLAETDPSWRQVGSGPSSASFWGWERC